jgi:acetate kinase
VRVLVANLGSSSLKLRVVGDGDRIEAPADLTAGADAGEIAAFVAHAGPVDAVGHRIVHGGSHYTAPVLVDDEVIADFEGLCDLAPLHNPPAFALLDQLRELLPDVAHVCCFDTAFHATMPAEAVHYAVPSRWRDDLGLRRYGFHGLSHEWAAERALVLSGRPRQGTRMVVCHLGAGASLAAVVDGACVDTTMGFTPVEGLVMATRSGDVDPGALFWAQERLGWSPAEMADALNHQSGLLGLSGVSGDLKEVLDLAASGHADAALAVDVYLHRLVKGVAAMAGSAGGIDLLVFTGGVGERSVPIRRAVGARLSFLGVCVDDELNQVESHDDRELSAPGSRARTLLVHAREELEIARQVRHVVGATHP